MLLTKLYAWALKKSGLFKDLPNDAVQYPGTSDWYVPAYGKYYDCSYMFYYNPLVQDKCGQWIVNEDCVLCTDSSIESRKQR